MKFKNNQTQDSISLSSHITFAGNGPAEKVYFLDKVSCKSLHNQSPLYIEDLDWKRSSGWL